jgi:hypothetical protein
LLCLFTVKLLVLNNWSYEQSLVIVALATISAVFHIKAKNNQVESIKLTLEMQSKEIEELKKQSDSIKATISGMKMAHSVKPVARF